MIRVRRKEYEEAVLSIINSTDLRELIREYSLFHVFFYSLLRDILRGSESPNFYVLKKIARDKKISERYIIDQAALALSCFPAQGGGEDHYKVLNVSATASAEEIRKSWLSLLKTSHPDNVGDSGLEATKRLNRAYEVLGNPEKRVGYDATHIPELPILIEEDSLPETGLKRLIYSLWA